jgi:hypothetical protein
MIRVPCTRRAGSAPPHPPRGAGRPASFLPKRRRRVGGRPAPSARAGGPGGSAPSPPHPPRGGAAHSLWPARSCLHSPSPACSPPVTPASHGGPNRPRPAEATTVTVTIPRSVRRDTIPHNARRDRDGESGRGGWRWGGVWWLHRRPLPPRHSRPVLRQHLGCRRQLRRSAPLSKAFAAQQRLSPTRSGSSNPSAPPGASLAPTRQAPACSPAEQQVNRHVESETTTTQGHADFTSPTLGTGPLRFMKAQNPCYSHPAPTFQGQLTLACRAAQGRSGETIELKIKA